MSGHRRRRGMGPMAYEREQRRRQFYRARIEVAENPLDRVSAASDYLRSTMARVDQSAAEIAAQSIALSTLAVVQDLEEGR